MPEPNGDPRFTQLEINNPAVHAGLSVPLRPSLTESPLPQTVLLMSSFPQKIWYLAILKTSDVTEVTWIRLGIISSTTELLLKLASHTLLDQALPQLALPNASTVNPSPSTNAKLAPSDNQELLPQSSLKSSPTVQLKVPSLSTTTSSTTRVVSTTTFLEVLPEVTPSKFSDTELKTVKTTGSALTHGEPHGENKVFSRSDKETAELKVKSSHAFLNSESSDDLLHHI
jgi:hypothetical protein